MIGKRESIKGITILLAMTIVFLFCTIRISATSVSQLESESTNLKEQLAGLNSEIVELSEEIDGVLRKIELTESEVARTQESLEVCREEESTQYEAMKLRIRYMYENGQSSMMEIIFGAESIVDLINRSELVSTITQYDRDMLQALVETRQQIEFEEINLVDQKKALLELEETTKVKQAELELKASQTSTDLVKVQKEIADIKEAQRIAAEKAAAEKAAAEKAAAEKAEAEAGNGSNSSGSTSAGNAYEGSSSDLDVFAAILDCEAIGNYNAMLAVATVIMNRVNSSQFPNSINGVVYQSGQFSPTWTGKLNRVLASGASSLAYRVAQDAMNGTRLSSVSHCYYFLTASSTNRNGVNVGGNLFFASW